MNSYGFSATKHTKDKSGCNSQSWMSGMPSVQMVLLLKMHRQLFRVEKEDKQ